MGCGQPAVTHEEADKETAEAKAAADWKVIEEVIRGGLLAHYGENPKGELTKSDYEKVTKLSFDRSQLTDVKGLEKLTQLEVLILWRNQLTDVKGLEKLTQLTSLILANNKLTDVKGLEKLTQLTFLNLRHNPDLTQAQIDELQKALPKCKIEHNAKR